MGLKPNELWNMSLADFYDMYDAFGEQLKLQDDIDTQRLAWQTAHLMTASGNYGKKGVKPTDLYIPLAEQEKKPSQDIIKKFDSKDAKQNYLDDLMKNFDKGE